MRILSCIRDLYSFFIFPQWLDDLQVEEKIFFAHLYRFQRLVNMFLAVLQLHRQEAAWVASLLCGSSRGTPSCHLSPASSQLFLNMSLGIGYWNNLLKIIDLQSLSKVPQFLVCRRRLADDAVGTRRHDLEVCIWLRPVREGMFLFVPASGQLFLNIASKTVETRMSELYYICIIYILLLLLLLLLL